TLVAFLKIPHRPSMLTDHLADMRRFMPPEHRELIKHVESMPSVRDRVARDTFNEALEALATFRETHYNFAQRYIAQWVADPRGTGGTPYLQWLGQLIDETRAAKRAWFRLPVSGTEGAASTKARPDPLEGRAESVDEPAVVEDDEVLEVVR